MPTSRSSADIDAWLEELWNLRGTDLLLTAGAPPLIRVDGEMRPVTGGQLMSPTSAERVNKGAAGPDPAAAYEAEREIDFAFSWQQRARLRCNAFHQRDSCSLALRIIPYEIPGVAQRRLP